ncbi:MAG: FecR domain-containing protein [Arcobacteraceae bacterium]|jgi:hypothetical protein|nr:FecR domain-containing protein [Arcobacteraceae bacterium]
MIKNLFYLIAINSLLFSGNIGVIEKGDVDKFENAIALVTRGNDVISVTDIGFKIQESDVIKTFRKSTVTIRLNDDTIIKIGQKTTLNIEKYLYDTQNKSGNTANLKIENGTFQIKTGSIGDDAPKNFKIKTKFSTIGLRG